MIETTDRLAISVGLRAKRQIRDFLKAEQRAVNFEYPIGDDVWIWYGGKVCDYDATFSEILSTFHFDSFRQLLAERKKKGLSAYVLDLMGGRASFLRDLKGPITRESFPPYPLDIGLCVSLVDERGKGLQDADKKHGIEILCDDMTSKSAWNRIDQWQKEKGIDAFDLIVCRGADAVQESMVPRALYPFLFDKIWSRLTARDGIFITHLPEKKVFPKELLERLKLIPGVTLHFQPKGDQHYKTYPALGIVKTNEAQRNT